MKIEVDKFLALTAVLAAGVMPGCVVQSGEDDEPSVDAGDAEPSASPPEESEPEGSEPEASSSEPETDDSGTAKTDSGGEPNECFGGDIGADVDCESLPYAGADCGAEYALGVEVCIAAKMAVRAEAAEALVDCLSDLDADDACGSVHAAGVALCYASVNPLVCDSEEASEWCEDYASECDEVDADSCSDALKGLNSYGLSSVAACVEETSPSEGCGMALTMCQTTGLPLPF